MGGQLSREVLFRKRHYSLSDIQTVHRLHRKTRRLNTWPTWPLLSIFQNLQFSRKRLSKEKLNGALFSDYEIMLIQNLWSTIAVDKEAFGIQVYRRIFECEPCLKVLFGWMDIDDEQMEFNPAFRRQANAIINLIDKCVRCLDKIDLMTTELTLLGKRHMRLRGYGFKSDHWKLFKMSIMLSVASVIENDGNKAWLLNAWDTLMTHITETMRMGFEQGIKSYFEKSASASFNDISGNKNYR